MTTMSSSFMVQQVCSTVLQHGSQPSRVSNGSVPAVSGVRTTINVKPFFVNFAAWARTYHT
jgi:hypothetical protein